MWRPLAVGVLALSLPLSAAAIPVLRLVLTGDASQLGSGAMWPFANYRLEALHLDRPALLTDIVKPLLRLEVEHEKAIQMDGPQFFSGTRAHNERAIASFVFPTRVAGRRLALLASSELSQGLLRLQDETDGLVTQIDEHRVRGALGLALEPWTHLRVGAATFFGAAPSYALEAIGTFGAFELGAQQRSEDLGYTLKIPRGPPAKLRRPELDYPIRALRRTTTLTARLRTAWTDSSASIDLVHNDPVLDGAVLLAPWFTLRGRYEQLHLSFENWASNKGVPVARIDLDTVLSRWAFGTELRWGRSELVVRYGATELSTWSSWVDNGEITGMQFFSLPIDFGLSLQQLFRARVTQWSLGWNWNFSPLVASVGLQHLQLHNDAGGYSYGSSVDVAIGGLHVFAPAQFEAVALTGGLSCVVANLRIRFAVAQLVPITGPPGGALASPRPPAAPSGPLPSTPAAPTPTTDGGRLVSFDIEQTF